MPSEIEEIIGFWVDQVGEAGWYRGDAALDEEIRRRFETTLLAAREGALDGWRSRARGALALLIVTDQFPRNMYRGSARAFATDPMARAIASSSIAQGHDLRIAPPARQFFYLPLEHSENGADQERAVRLIAARLDAPETLLHARAHREVIARFGRFPFRNAALGRRDTADESAFLDAGGYGAVVRHLRDASV